MKNIADIDENFKVSANVAREGIRFYNAEEKPFEIYGAFWENEKLRRLPESVAKAVSPGVHAQHADTAGVRVRFVTDSPYVAISAAMGRLGKMPHFALTGSTGFDLYADNEYVKTFVPPFAMTDGYDSLIELGERREREITVNFPLYSDVKRLYIGLDGAAAVKSPAPYKNEKPVVYYGSSITQGALTLIT